MALDKDGKNDESLLGNIDKKPGLPVAFRRQVSPCT